MPVFIEAIKKIAPYFKYIVFGTAIVALLFIWKSKSNQLTQLEQAMALYKRQMSGQLTDKEKELQSAHIELGLSASKLMEQKALARAFEQDKIKTSAEFETFKKKHNLELESYQKTIASLKQQINGGTTVVSGGEPRLPGDPRPDPQFNKPIDPQVSKLAYDWKSEDGRFELQDPDVFVHNNETFKLQQNFRITGEVYREKAGFLKTQRLTVEEVLPDGTNPDGTVKYKTVASANVVDSHFNYTERAPDSWVPKKSVFGVWGIISGSFSLNNGLNPRFMLGTGIEFLQWRGLGVGLQLYFDTSQWKESGFGVSLSYRPTIKGTKLNLGVNIGIATQFQQPFQSYIPILGLNFYLW